MLLIQVNSSVPVCVVSHVALLKCARSQEDKIPSEASEIE